MIFVFKVDKILQTETTDQKQGVIKQIRYEDLKRLNIEIKKEEIKKGHAFQRPYPSASRCTPDRTHTRQKTGKLSL
jgi:hypothetical protein